MATLRLGTPGRWGLHSAVQEAFGPLQSRAMRRGVRLRCELPEGCEAPDDVPAFRRTLILLLDRALTQSPEGGEIYVTACRVGGCIELEIADQGEACERDQRIRWRNGQGDLPFERGLASLLQSGCEVRAHRCADGGTAFTLFLPARTRRAAA